MGTEREKAKEKREGEKRSKVFVPLGTSHSSHTHLTLISPQKLKNAHPKRTDRGTGDKSGPLCLELKLLYDWMHWIALHRRKQHGD